MSTRQPTVLEYQKSALALKKNSNENDVLVSMHAPYYINLSSNKDDVIERSVKRLVQAAKASEWMGAYRTVFHPGFYTTYTPDEAMGRCKNSIEKFRRLLKHLAWEITLWHRKQRVKISAGDLNEIIEICSSFDHFEPTVDFAHIHARSGGSLNSKNDYNEIFQKLEEGLGLKSLHSHFTHVEYTGAGERKHHGLEDENYGPPIKPLLEEIVECGWNVTVICESPYIDHDALIMKGMYQNMSKN